jgi:hypothetical protein
MKQRIRNLSDGTELVLVLLIAFGYTVPGEPRGAAVAGIFRAPGLAADHERPSPGHRPL